MVVLGIILLVLGLIFGISLLVWLGLILIIIGAVLWAAGTARTGGRRWY